MANLRTLWDMPHRPLFLAAGVWAVVALVWWYWGEALGLPVPQLGSAALWHGHEMLFGLGAAPVGGYFLSASMGWRGGPPVAGGRLIVLVALWGLGRAAMLAEGLGAGLSPWLLHPVMTSYFVYLAYLLAREALAAKRLPKLGFAAGVLGFALAEALFLRAALGATFPTPELAVRLGWMFFALKISIVGGRMVPAFTANWLRQIRSTVPEPQPDPLAGWLALGLLWLALALTLAGAETASALSLATAGAVQLFRLARWRGWQTWRNPLLLLLHLTFGWLGLSFILIGLARLWLLPITEIDALHALTMGAMGGMILSLAARAAAPRDGGPLQARPSMVAAFALIWAAAGLRLLAPILPLADPVTVAALLWCAGWVTFLAGYLPTVTGPIVRPVFSGPRATAPAKMGERDER